MPNQFSLCQVIKPPENLWRAENDKTLFLAGSINGGQSIDWQNKVQEEFFEDRVTIFNPRRETWDFSWVQSINNPQFFEQVNWELSALERATVIAMYFEGESFSPISLLELGLFAHTNKLVVYCPK